ncbi:MAG: orotate phosphoribosyltransferase [Candidatus Aenigmarchaeota archaeon]|nr:orotate phosphoribosyltransferase [Candidatus Aenigmarchaeota archaeon]
MELYKQEFIDFLVEKDAFKVGDFVLKSGRKSPYFVNTGVFDDGRSISNLGYFYASKITDSFEPQEYDLIFGPSYKGIPLSVATVIALDKDFHLNKRYLFDRKESKGHGEATKQEMKKNRVIGSIHNSDEIIMVDDVFTTGHTKYDSVNLLNSLADNLKYTGLVIAVDRQETGVDGTNAIEQFEEKTGIPVSSIVNINEIRTYLSRTEKISDVDAGRIEDYLCEYGVKI